MENALISITLAQRCEGSRFRPKTYRLLACGAAWIGKTKISAHAQRCYFP